MPPAMLRRTTAAQVTGVSHGGFARFNQGVHTGIHQGEGLSQTPRRLGSGHGSASGSIDLPVASILFRLHRVHEHLSWRSTAAWRARRARSGASMARGNTSNASPQAVKLKDGEVVVFSWIVYASRRDRVNKPVMAAPFPRDDGDNGSEVFAVRRQANVSWRLQDARRVVAQAPSAEAHRLGITRSGPMDVQDHLDSRPAAISASLAMVFMLRAVPDFAAGIFSRESAMPSP